MIAAAKGNLEIVKLLFDLTADIDAIDNRGKTALMSAAGCIGGKDVAEFLLQNGANLFIKDSFDKTAEDNATAVIRRLFLNHQLENLWIMRDKEYENVLQWFPREIKNDLIAQVKLPN